MARIKLLRAARAYATARAVADALPLPNGAPRNVLPALAALQDLEVAARAYDDAVRHRGLPVRPRRAADVQTLKQAKNAAIERALVMCGTVTAAAAALGVTRQSLQRMMRRADSGTRRSQGPGAAGSPNAKKTRSP